MQWERGVPVVIADTTPLNYLVQLGHVSLLESLFGSVFVPRSVLVKLSHAGSPFAVHAWAASPPPWLNVKDDVPFDAELAAVLDPGERDAISLATQISASFLLIDEHAARRVAEGRRFNVIGTLAVPLEGSLLMKLDFPALLTNPRQLRFRMSPQLEATMLNRYYSGRREERDPSEEN